MVGYHFVAIGVNNITILLMTPDGKRTELTTVSKFFLCVSMCNNFHISMALLEGLIALHIHEK